MKKILLTATLFFLTILPFQLAEAVVVIDFDDLDNGEIVTTQYLVSDGLTISTENYHRSHDLGIIFDSTLTGTEDTDLEDPWSGGNIPSQEKLKNMLIIAEDDEDDDNDGLIDDPDDEKGKPAGTITFTFAYAIDSFGFDFVDVDQPASTFTLSFYNGNSYLDMVSLADYLDATSPLYDGTIVHGDNYANRYKAITSSLIGSDFDKIVFEFGGSGAIDNINFNTTVPEPMSMTLFSIGLVGAGIRQRMSKKKK